jgi:hypothetical protein
LGSDGSASAGGFVAIKAPFSLFQIRMSVISISVFNSSAEKTGRALREVTKYLREPGMSGPRQS